LAYAAPEQLMGEDVDGGLLTRFILSIAGPSRTGEGTVAQTAEGIALCPD
jgi:hypothetical protein